MADNSIWGYLEVISAEEIVISLLLGALSRVRELQRK
jgi:hypothetical protein